MQSKHSDAQLLSSQGTLPSEPTVALTEIVPLSFRDNDFALDYIPRAIHNDHVEELLLREEGVSGRRPARRQQDTGIRGYGTEPRRFNNYMLSQTATPVISRRQLLPAPPPLVPLGGAKAPAAAPKGRKHGQRTGLGGSQDALDERMVVLTDLGIDILAPAFSDPIQPLAKAPLENPQESARVYLAGRHKALPRRYARTQRAATWKNTLASARVECIERARLACEEMVARDLALAKEWTLRYVLPVDDGSPNRMPVKRSGLSFRGRGRLEDAAAAGKINGMGIHAPVQTVFAKVVPNEVVIDPDTCYSDIIEKILKETEFQDDATSTKLLVADNIAEKVPNFASASTKSNFAFSADETEAWASLTTSKEDSDTALKQEKVKTLSDEWLERERKQLDRQWGRVSETSDCTPHEGGPHLTPGNTNKASDDSLGNATCLDRENSPTPILPKENPTTTLPEINNPDYTSANNSAPCLSSPRNVSTDLQSNENAASKTASITGFEAPNWGHDHELQNASVGAVHTVEIPVSIDADWPVESQKPLSNCANSLLETNPKDNETASLQPSKSLTGSTSLSQTPNIGNSTPQSLNGSSKFVNTDKETAQKSTECNNRSLPASKTSLDEPLVSTKTGSFRNFTQVLAKTVSLHSSKEKLAAKSSTPTEKASGTKLGDSNESVLSNKSRGSKQSSNRSSVKQISNSFKAKLESDSHSSATSHPRPLDNATIDKSASLSTSLKTSTEVVSAGDSTQKKDHSIESLLSNSSASKMVVETNFQNTTLQISSDSDNLKSPAAGCSDNQSNELQGTVPLEKDALAMSQFNVPLFSKIHDSEAPYAPGHSNTGGLGLLSFNDSLPEDPWRSKESLSLKDSHIGEQHLTNASWPYPAASFTVDQNNSATLEGKVEVQQQNLKEHNTAELESAPKHEDPISHPPNSQQESAPSHAQCADVCQDLAQMKVEKETDAPKSLESDAINLEIEQSASNLPTQTAVPPETAIRRSIDRVADSRADVVDVTSSKKELKENVATGKDSQPLQCEKPSAERKHSISQTPKESSALPQNAGTAARESPEPQQSAPKLAPKQSSKSNLAQFMNAMDITKLEGAKSKVASPVPPVAAEAIEAAKIQNAVPEKQVEIKANLLPTAEEMTAKATFEKVKCQIRVENMLLTCIDEKKREVFSAIEVSRIVKAEATAGKPDVVVSACVTRDKGKAGSKFKSLDFSFDGGAEKAHAWAQNLMILVYGSAIPEKSVFRKVLCLTDRFEKDSAKLVEKYMKPIWKCIGKDCEVIDLGVSHAISEVEWHNVTNVVMMNADFSGKMLQILVKNGYADDPGRMT
ncbi:hypothetical protein HDU83_004867 [Entophlyctis luteolus]|nr:hypothetical protein HDU83_004867 [Entophlyctis luteolus]